MARSSGISHIIRGEDGLATAVWGVFTLKSAFQPLFSLARGKAEIAAYEGLIRPFRDGQMLPPYVFFTAIPAADRFEVETVTRTLHLLNAGKFLDRNAMIFVNFDPSLFVDPALADMALRDMRLVLHEAGIEADRIVCEMTEQKSDSDRMLLNFVDALRAHGFRIAVDDYGADDSDMERIKRLKPDVVKFDAHWINKLMDSREGYALLEIMVKRFREQRVLTVFEGIEEHWQLELAERCGADFIQGYVLARPELAPTNFKIFAHRGPEARRPDVHWRSPDAPEPINIAPPARAFGRRSS